MHQAVIGIASNINPHVSIEKAMMLIREEFTVLRKSTFVRTEPIDDPGAHYYVNGAILVETLLDEEQLKFYLKKFEKFLGRTDDQEGVLIDFDLLVFNGQQIHPDIQKYDFIKQALREIELQ